jgi:hypothetical protein
MRSEFEDTYELSIYYFEELIWYDKLERFYHSLMFSR